jgi:hypothetical protein
MTARRFNFPLVAVLATSFVAPACYTLLKHPRIETAVYEAAENRRCSSCHEDEEIWGYIRPESHPVYPVEGDWDYYYVYPWWWDSYWYFAPSGPSTAPPPSRHLRPVSEKDPVDPAAGAAVGPPPEPKSTGTSVRVKDSTGQGKGEKDDKPRESKDKPRPVRPKGKKGQEDG